MVCLRRSGVWSSSGWTKLETEKQTFPRNRLLPPPPPPNLTPLTLCAHLPPGLLASGAIQPVWDNVTVYGRSGPHTLAQGGSGAREEAGAVGGGEICGGGRGISATVTFGGKKANSGRLKDRWKDGNETLISEDSGTFIVHWTHTFTRPHVHQDSTQSQDSRLQAEPIRKESIKTEKNTTQKRWIPPADITEQM